jgi:hypothetical protein
MTTDLNAITAELDALTDPAEIAARTASIRDTLRAKRETLLPMRDTAAVSLAVYDGVPEPEVRRVIGITTHNGWKKLGERVRKAHPVKTRKNAKPVTDKTAVRVAKYYGKPPVIVNARETLDDVVPEIAAIDMAIRALDARHNAAMIAMVRAGAANHEVAKAADVSSSYVAQFISKHGLTRPVREPVPA